MRIIVIVVFIMLEWGLVWLVNLLLKFDGFNYLERF